MNSFLLIVVGIGLGGIVNVASQKLANASERSVCAERLSTHQLIYVRGAAGDVAQCLPKYANGVIQP